jgi:hypothetical protein
VDKYSYPLTISEYFYETSCLVDEILQSFPVIRVHFINAKMKQALIEDEQEISQSDVIDDLNVCFQMQDHIGRYVSQCLRSNCCSSPKACISRHPIGR